MHEITDFLFGKKALKKAADQGASAKPAAAPEQSYDYIKDQIAASSPQKKFVPALQPTRKQLGATAKDPAVAELASPRTPRRKK